MGSRVEQFEQIRRDRDARVGVLSGTGCIAGRQQALAWPVSAPKRTPTGRPAPKLGAYRELIDRWLVDDREAPRKQCHTASGSGSGWSTSTARVWVRRTARGTALLATSGDDRAARITLRGPRSGRPRA